MLGGVYALVKAQGDNMVLFSAKVAFLKPSSQI